MLVKHLHARDMEEYMAENVVARVFIGRQDAPNHRFGPLQHGPNLAKGDFLAKYSRSEAKIGKKSICHSDRGAPYGPLSGRHVCIMGRLRSFDCTGGSNPDARAAELRQTAWLNRKNELLVHAPALLGSRPGSTWPIFGASLD